MPRLNDPRRWRVTDHVCRFCFGRILVRTAESGEDAVRCAECGAEADPGGASSLCACGARLTTGKPAGLRCVPNPVISLSVPEQIMVIHADPDLHPEPPKAPMGARGLPAAPDS